MFSVHLMVRKFQDCSNLRSDAVTSHADCCHGDGKKCFEYYWDHMFCAFCNMKPIDIAISRIECT